MATMADSGSSRGDGSEGKTLQSTSTIVPAANNSDYLSLQITTHKLTGKNFLQWSRSVQLVIRGKGKFGYLDGTIAKPSVEDPSYPSWEIQWLWPG